MPTGAECFFNPNRRNRVGLGDSLTGHGDPPLAMVSVVTARRQRALMALLHLSFTFAFLLLSGSQIAGCWYTSSERASGWWGRWDKGFSHLHKGWLEEERRGILHCRVKSFSPILARFIRFLQLSADNHSRGDQAENRSLLEQLWKPMASFCACVCVFPRKSHSVKFSTKHGVDVTLVTAAQRRKWIGAQDKHAGSVSRPSLCFCCCNTKL